MKTWFRRLLTVFCAALLMLCLGCAAQAEAGQKLTVLFTSDIHSYLIAEKDEIEGTIREHGGAGRLQTLLEANRNDHTVVVDSGDFSIGTLLETGVTSEAYELRLMGRAGLDATTFGNHEFDTGTLGAAAMLNAAADSGERIPQIIIPANLDLSGTLDEAQQQLKDALDRCGAKRWFIKEVDGIRVAVFGMLGKNAQFCAPTSGVQWRDCVESAKEIVKEIGDQADVILCISHSGTNDDGQSGEDVTLIKEVPELDVVISGHSHTTYKDAVIVREGSVLGSCGAYLAYIGRIDLTLNGDGTVTCDDYRLIACDESVESNAETDAVVDGYLEEISRNYEPLNGASADDVVAHSGFTMLSNDFCSQGREDIPLGNLIADSYLYACRQAGDTETEVAFVWQGTIRSSILAGDITEGRVFEVCSAGVGNDGTMGHDLITGYIPGWELRLLAEVDAFVGGSLYDVEAYFSGMEVEFDLNRLPFERVTSIRIVHADGTTEPLDNNRLYKVIGNQYALNMIDEARSMTGGVINLNFRDDSGKKASVEGYADMVLREPDGTAYKEWEALRDYLASFPVNENGIPEVPEQYSAPEGRKTVVQQTFWERITHPGFTVGVLAVLVLLIVLIVILIVRGHRKRRARKAAKKTE